MPTPTMPALLLLAAGIAVAWWPAERVRLATPTLAERPMCVVEFVVVDEAWRPLPGAVVHVHDVAARYRYSTGYRAAGGVIAIEVPAGPKEISVGRWKSPPGPEHLLAEFRVPCDFRVTARPGMRPRRVARLVPGGYFRTPWDLGPRDLHAVGIELRSGERRASRTLFQSPEGGGCRLSYPALEPGTWEFRLAAGGHLGSPRDARGAGPWTHVVTVEAGRITDAVAR